MDFGKVSPAELARIDFTLPPDHPITRRVLPGQRNAAPQVYVGCPIWANKAWNGKLYPPGARDKDYLKLYARQFNGIELNVTHYQIPDAETVERWKSNTSPAFRFCPKMPQTISHLRQLQEAEDLTEAFCEAVAGLGEQLGVVFLQLPPSFGPNQLPVLEAFVRHFPSAISLAVEFRHPDWFRQPARWQQTVEMLHNYHISTVMTDVAGRRDVLHQSLTTPVALIRYVGNMARPDDYRRLDAWVERFAGWIDQGLEQLYFFVHEHENIISPEVARYFIRRLNERCQLQVAEPRLLAQAVQGSLF